jgi:hypothetical protein
MQGVFSRIFGPKPASIRPLEPAWQTADFSPPESTCQGTTPIEKVRVEKGLLAWEADPTREQLACRYERSG